MNTRKVLLLIVIQLMVWGSGFAQQAKFSQITKNKLQATSYTAIIRDGRGFIWFIGYVNPSSQAFLARYDGTNFVTYHHEPQNPNSIQNFPSVTLAADKYNHIWIGFNGGGLDRLDPETGVFTHFHHQAADPSSVSSDTVTVLLADRKGRLWAGTTHGLNLVDLTDGHCTRYVHRGADPKSLSADTVSCLLEDHKGNLWVGCTTTRLPPVNDPTAAGGLNLLRNAGGFTRFLHNPADASSLISNQLSCLFEDSKGKIWIGTQGNGLSSLDSRTGKFTYYPYDSTHPDRLQSLSLGKEFYGDHISFIREDKFGGMWIGSSTSGLIHYDLATGKTQYLGSQFRDKKVNFGDTTSGLTQLGFFGALATPDGLLWFTTFSPAAVYNVSFYQPRIPFEPMPANGNAFYLESRNRVLWIGTNKGLVRKDLLSKNQKWWAKDTPNGSKWAHDTIGNMTRDTDGQFWIATLGGGLGHFDPATNKIAYFLHNNKDPGSISSNLARNLLIDRGHNIWVGTWGSGLDMLDNKTKKFRHYKHDTDSLSLSDNTVDAVFQDKDGSIWAGTFQALDHLNADNKTFHHYLKKNGVFGMLRDKAGVLWAATAFGLFRYDRAKDSFIPFLEPGTGISVGTVLAMQEDAESNLWLRTTTAIIKINRQRTNQHVYGESWGVNGNNIWISRSLAGENGELFFGTLNGYFDFFPDQIKDASPPDIEIDEFKIENAPSAVSQAALTAAGEGLVTLTHRQNTITLDFTAVHFDSPGEEKYQVMLQNYDHTWRDMNDQNQVSFFSIPDGQYLLRIRAQNPDGAWAEKDIKVVINPPWYRTWWTYTLFVLAAISSMLGFIKYRNMQLIKENRILEQNVNQRTEELQVSLKELKAAQNQLIQAEKMASLGELTAGIAHEIQNPLNFVNNFSEVSLELLEETNELPLDNLGPKDQEYLKDIINDLTQNLTKINQHGKRAEKIVKGMLQHSQVSSNKAEPTDINKLVEEHLQLALHSIKAKNKDFEATLSTSFDAGLPLVAVVPQDIGRVIVNVLNNAFYVVDQMKKRRGADYVPAVSVNTAKTGGLILISIKDNGEGIPEAIREKIMQPFFTTKPTGEGTGLGLSLSYDIVVKGHAGKIEVNSKQGDGAEFVISLPIK